MGQNKTHVSNLTARKSKRGRGAHQLFCESEPKYQLWFLSHIHVYLTDVSLRTLLPTHGLILWLLCFPNQLYHTLSNLFLDQMSKRDNLIGLSSLFFGQNLCSKPSEMHWPVYRQTTWLCAPALDICGKEFRNKLHRNLEIKWINEFGRIILNSEDLRGYLTVS